MTGVTYRTDLNHVRCCFRLRDLDRPSNLHLDPYSPPSGFKTNLLRLGRLVTQVPKDAAGAQLVLLFFQKAAA